MSTRSLSTDSPMASSCVIEPTTTWNGCGCSLPPKIIRACPKHNRQTYTEGVKLSSCAPPKPVVRDGDCEIHIAAAKEMVKIKREIKMKKRMSYKMMGDGLGVIEEEELGEEYQAIIDRVLGKGYPGEGNKGEGGNKSKRNGGDKSKGDKGKKENLEFIGGKT
ncbi:hypothetical protein K470DRAFT_273161 [Piedraia hortae CBS 480.64]|uniref:Uncharacterized protein n=1 Tax=Piedraia hortae CBS 480.64 TaxID=1314780 RepID=A0A6A7BRP6_9PEZI|nr:hypothetical protein K470DRAFT_273161 [Piedraia hortae CBS 480.64]